MSKRKYTHPVWVIAFVALAAFFLFAFVAVKRDNNFGVTHFAEEKTVTGPDGRTPAGSPEVFKITNSPALAWELAGSGAKTCRAIAPIGILVMGVFLFAFGTGRISFGEGSNAPGSILFGIMAVTAGLMFGGHSYDNSYIEVLPDKFTELTGQPADPSIKSVKDNTGQLTAIFTEKKLTNTLIR